MEFIGELAQRGNPLCDYSSTASRSPFPHKGRLTEETELSYMPQSKDKLSATEGGRFPQEAFPCEGRWHALWA